MKRIFLICLIFCSCSADTIEKRQEVAEELLSSQCDLIIYSAINFVDSKVISGLLDWVLGNRCDCVKELLIPKMTEKYTLKQLKDFRKEPFNVKVAIKDLIRENQIEVRNCFSFTDE